MSHPRARAHALNFARFYLTGITHAVAMLQRSVNHIGDNFHFLVRMHWESARGLHYVVVKYAQRPERNVGRIVIVVEGKVPVSGEPARVQVMPLRAANNLNHGILPYKFASASTI